MDGVNANGIVKIEQPDKDDKNEEGEGSEWPQIFAVFSGK